MTTQRKSSLNVIKLFNADHKRVLKQLIELQNAIENAKDGPNIKKATGLLKAIEQEMNEHFRREEESLFPALNHYFEKALKKIGGNIRPESPVKVMLLEHKALRMITQNLETALDRDNMMTLRIAWPSLQTSLEATYSGRKTFCSSSLTPDSHKKKRQRLPKRYLAFSRFVGCRFCFV